LNIFPVYKDVFGSLAFLFFGAQSSKSTLIFTPYYCLMTSVVRVTCKWILCQRYSYAVFDIRRFGSTISAAEYLRRLNMPFLKKTYFVIILLFTCLIFSAGANAYLIKDFGFTNLANGGLKAKVHSILNFDSAYAPGKYDYVYQVTNTGNVVIDDYGVFAGALAAINKNLCTIAANAGACAAPGALPNWISNLARPDLSWGIKIASDGLAIPANYNVVWSKNNGLGIGQTLTFQVASPNPPIVGGAFIDPDATSSGFYIKGSDGTIAQANYVPEPSVLALLVTGLIGSRLARRRNHSA